MHQSIQPAGLTAGGTASPGKAGVAGAAISRWLPILFCVFLCWLLVSPVLPILYQAFLDKPLYDPATSLTLGNFTRLVLDPEFTKALLNTVAFAGVTTIFSVSLGLLYALGFDRIDLPFRRTLRILVISPILISPLILAFAWSMLYGQGSYVAIFMLAYLGIGLPNLNSFGGMCLIAGLVQAPISYLYLGAAAANIPDVFERSALSAGASRFTALYTIVLPLLKPTISYCVLLNFMLCVDLLGVPLIIGEPANILVLSTFLYTKGAISAHMDYGIIAAAGFLTVIFVQAIVWLQGRWIGDRRRYVTVGGRSSQTTRIDVGGMRWVISGGIGLFALLTVVIPAAFLVLRSFTSILSPLLPLRSVLTLKNYWDILQYEQYVRSIWNSLLISSIGGLAAVALTFIAVVFAYRTTYGVRIFIEQVAMIPRAIPGLVVGIGIFYGMILFPGGEFLRNTLIILAIAFTIRSFPTGFGALSPAFAQIGEDLDRAARISGAGRLRAIKDISVPLMKGALLACFAIYFINFFKEYSTAAFLFGPGTEVVGTTMLALNYTGYLGTLAALATIELVILVPITAMIYMRR